MGKNAGGGARTGFGFGANSERGQIGFAPNISQRTRLAMATTEAMRRGVDRIRPVPSPAAGDQGATIAAPGRARAVNPRNAMTASMVRVEPSRQNPTLPRPNQVGQYQFEVNGRLRGYSPRPFREAANLARRVAAEQGTPVIRFRGTI